MDIGRTLVALSQDHHGVFLATKSGLSRGELRTARRRGWIAPVLPGVMRTTASPEMSAQRGAAALLWAGPGAQLAGRSAAERWAISGIDAPTPEIWSRTDKRHVAVLVRRSVVDRGFQRRCRSGLWVATPEWTLRDLAGAIDDEALEVAFEEFRLRRLVTVESVASHLDRWPVRTEAGCATLRALATELVGTCPTESPLEVRVARLLRRHRVERPERQVRVGDRRIDFAWPWRRVALECFGERWRHDPAVWRRDLARLSELGAATGYTILVATAADLAAPDRLVERIHQAFATRAA